MRRAAAAIVALLGACAAGTDMDNAAGESVFTVTMDSEDVESGGRPRLTIACGEVGRSLMLHLVRLPDAASQRIGVGAFGVDGDPPIRVALAWVREDVWSPRMDDGAQAALIRRIVAGRRAYFTGPLGTTDHVYRWDMERLGDTLPRLRAACA